MRLNRIVSNIDRTEREKINSNFDIIENGYKKVFDDSNEAKEIAQGIDGKVMQAINTASQANTKSDNAVIIAAQKGNEAVDIAKQANNTSNYVQQQLDTVIIESGDANPEVAQARADFTNLRERLDTEFGQVVESLTHATLKTNKEILASKNKKGALITIIDDDGATAILNTWIPILQSGRKFKLDIGVISGWAGNSGYLTWDQLEQIKSDYPDVVDLINHSFTHPYHATLTEEQLHEQFSKSYKALYERGHTADVYVYPYGSVNELTRKVAKQYVRGAFEDSGGLNTITPLEQYQIRRVLLNEHGVQMGDVSQYTAHIDQAIIDGAWLVFMSHSQFSGFDIEKFNAIIDYANSKSGQIEWVSASEGLNRRGNIMDIGDYVYGGSNDYTIIDCDGKWHSNQTRLVNSKSEVKFDTPLTSFEIGYTVSLIFNGTDATPFPLGVGGLLETYRDGSGNFSHQRYRPYNQNRFYQRIWSTSVNGWLEFSDVSGYVTRSSATFDAPPTSFAPTQLTVSTIVDADATKFPTAIGGILETHRHSTDAYTYQIYKPRGSNALFTRRWDGSTWTVFSDVSGINSATYKNIDVVVPAQGFTTVEIATMTAVNSNVVTTPVGGLEENVLYSVVTDNTKVYLRLYNPSASSVAVRRQFKVNLIRNL